MNNLIILTILFVSFGITFLRADDKPLFAPQPARDPVASKKYSQGAGIFEIIVDKPSGKVQAVWLRSSTNDVLLDADVINTFLQWRFKPNTQSFVRIVVAFKADSDAAFYPIVRTFRPTNRGLPIPFTEPIAPGKLWQWFSELYGAAGHR